MADVFAPVDLTLDRPVTYRLTVLESDEGRPPLTTSVASGPSMPGLFRRRWPKIALDSLLLVGFLAEFITREGPDYAVHSWIGIVLVPVIALHLTGNASWISRVWRRRREDREFGLGVLNAVLGTLAAICILTGFPIWLDWSDAGAWATVHTITGFGSILLMFAHLWKNRSRVGRLIRPA